MPGTTPHKASSWAPARKPPETPDEIFENGAIFECPNGELVYSLFFDEGPGASKWLHSYKPYTRWVLVGNSYDTPLYLIPVEGRPFDLRAGKEAPFTILELCPRGAMVDICEICGAHAFSGSIQHRPRCPRGRVQGNTRTSTKRKTTSVTSSRHGSLAASTR